MQTPVSVPTQRLDVLSVTRLIEQHFPLVHEGSGQLVIEAVAPGAARVRMRQDPRNIRPGGTVAGPAMFKLADFAVYVAIIGQLGEAGIQTATASMTMNFLSRPEPADMIAHVRLIKVGRRLAVADVELFSDGKAAMVAHAISSYALPTIGVR